MRSRAAILMSSTASLALAAGLFAGVLRAGQAAAAETHGRHSEVPAVFLNEHVRGDLGRTEQ